MNRVGAIETIWQDTRYALRTMRSRPVFAATAIVTLALAIGGNTAMFTVIRAVLLQPLQYREPDRLVRMADGATPSRFAEMKAGAHSFSEIGAFTGLEDLALSGGAEPEVLKAVHVSAGFLRILAIMEFYMVLDAVSIVYRRNQASKGAVALPHIFHPAKQAHMQMGGMT